MKVIVLAASLAIAATVSAQAADLTVKAPAPAPIAAPLWSGFYAGVNVGGSWQSGSIGFSDPYAVPGNSFAVCSAPAGVPLPTAPFSCGKDSSIIFGGQFGYNWQFGPWVYGLEGDGAWQHLINRSYTRYGANPLIPGNTGAPFGTVATDTAYLQGKIGALGTIRGRFGYAFDNFMLYGTGGVAIGGVDHQVLEILAPGDVCGGCAGATDNKTKVGWTAGAGLDWMFANRWSVGVEYLYVDLGKDTLNVLPIPASVFQNVSSATFNNTEHLVRMKLNYHFGAW
ncbi:MAG: outer membrane beta-barrel protein [Xanthobacteraceae bacterium]|nr:outer membrane beta-barrel protein [Xanthobacteraceae bacterium]